MFGGCFSAPRRWRHDLNRVMPCAALCAVRGMALIFVPLSMNDCTTDHLSPSPPGAWLAGSVCNAPMPTCKPRDGRSEGMTQPCQAGVHRPGKGIAQAVQRASHSISNVCIRFRSKLQTGQVRESSGACQRLRHSTPQRNQPAPLSRAGRRAAAKRRDHR